MKLATFLQLGRVSNLPTVWTNVATGVVLAPLHSTPHYAEQSLWRTLAVGAVAGSLLYVGGMFLNDAYDARWDAQHRPERPIPSGQVTLREVLLWGYGMLAAGVALVSSAVPLLLSSPGHYLADTHLQLASPAASHTLPSVPYAPLWVALFTLAAIVTYNRHHKGVAYAPVVMGLCRLGVVLIGATLATPRPSVLVLFAAAALGTYVVGLTHVARFETASAVRRLWIAALTLAPAILALLWSLLAGRSALLLVSVFALLQLGAIAWSIRLVLTPRPHAIPKAVGGLIAAIALVDATFIAISGLTPLALLACLAWAATLQAQRRVAGT